MVVMLSHSPKFTSKDLFQNFMEINSRGPETFSFHNISPNIFLVFHRLAIHRLTSLGNQPFVKQISKTKSIYPVCNCKIYNYDEIIQSIQSDPLQITSRTVKKLILLFIPNIRQKNCINSYTILYQF